MTVLRVAPVRTRLVLFVLCLAASTVACGRFRRAPTLPTGPGQPFSDYSAAYEQATASCRGVRTFVGVITLSGKAGTVKLRGNLEAGFAAPGQMRLEAPGPFGSRPLFTLVARGAQAVLVLPRDGRILRDAPAESIVEALAGVPVGAEELRAVVSGCGFGVLVVQRAEVHGGGWASVSDDRHTQWLRRVDGAWRLVATTRENLEVRYAEFSSGRPARIRIRTTPAASADITLALSQVDLNVPLETGTFEVAAPQGAAPITLEELRRSGPLGQPTAGR